MGSFRLELCNKTLSQKRKEKKKGKRKEGKKEARLSGGRGGGAGGGEAGGGEIRFWEAGITSSCESQVDRFELNTQGCCFPA